MKLDRKNINRIDILNEFSALPDSAWFGQQTVAAVRGCSVATVERERWSGGGVPFVKSGRSVRYRKVDIQRWLASHQLFESTTQAQQS